MTISIRYREGDGTAADRLQNVSYRELSFYQRTLHAQMMATAVNNLVREQTHLSEAPLGLFCLTVPPMNGASDSSIPTTSEKMQKLYELGYGIVLVRAREIYKMSSIVQRFTSLPIRFVIGISVLLRVFEDDYQHLGGSILKATSVLFSQNVRIYVYPMAAPTVRGWLNKLNATGWEWSVVEGSVVADSIKPPAPLHYLYEYLLASHFIVPVASSNASQSVATIRLS